MLKLLIKKQGHILSESGTIAWLGISIILFCKKADQNEDRAVIGEDTYNAGPLVFCEFSSDLVFVSLYHNLKVISPDNRDFVTFNGRTNWLSCKH